MSKKEVEICFKCNQKQREQIRKNAKSCGMKQGEYLLQRALGSAPKETQLGAYLNLYRKLCELTNLPLFPETEAKLNGLIDSIYAHLFESVPPSEEIRIEEEQALQDYYADIGDD